MKLNLCRSAAVGVAFLSQIALAPAMTFTHDAYISPTNMVFEDQDIVVTHCTLTVDGVTLPVTGAPQLFFRLSAQPQP